MQRRNGGARTASQLEVAAKKINAVGAGRALAIPADVRYRGAIAAAVASGQAELGAISLLVNNAGTAGPAGLEWEVDPTVWWSASRMVKTDLLLSYTSHPALAAFLDGAPDEAFVPPTVGAGVVTRIAAGDFDALSGRFLDATTNLDALTARATDLSGEALTLRLVAP